MKLWVLTPSTKRTRGWPTRLPARRMVFGGMWPTYEFKEIWVGYRSGLSGGSRGGVLGGLGMGILWVVGSSSSAMRRKTLEAHRCPMWNFSSQLKQRPRSLREAISSGDKRFKASGWGWEGVGKRGGRGIEDIG